MSDSILIDCPQCAGDMAVRRIPRLGAGVALAGTVLLGSGVVLVVVALSLFSISAASGEMKDELASIDREFALEALQEVEDLPDRVYDEFARDEAVSSESLAQLPEEMRTEVESILDDYHDDSLETVPAPFGGVPWNLWGSTLLVGGLPAAILGFFLARKRKIRLCLDCGHEQAP